jgi:hypothetical protein
MTPTRHLPHPDRLSVITAVIILAYTLTRVLDLPSRAIHTTLFGSDLGFDLNGRVLMLVLVAALISAGSDTLVRSHPRLAQQSNRSTVIHWILPGASALVLGAALNLIPNGLLWWLGLAGSALVLITVLIAEYISVDRDDPAWELAALGLTALAYGLALVLFALLRSVSARAVISATIGGLVAGGLTLRLFALKAVPLGRATLYASVVAVVSAESIWALSYWRITASSAGLLAMIPFYLVVGLAQQHLSGQLTRRIWIEYAVIGGLGMAIALAYAFTKGLTG